MTHSYNDQRVQLLVCSAISRWALARGFREPAASAVRLMLLFAAVAGVHVDHPRATAGELEHIVVHRDDTMYYITPWLIRLKNGELIVTAREAHRRPRHLISHVDPTARGILLRSRDSGRTWGEKRVIDDETHRFSQTEDVPVAQLSDGSLIVNTYSWTVSALPAGAEVKGANRYAINDVGGHPYIPVFEGTSLLRSVDQGRTWSPRQRIRMEGLGRFGARAPVTEMPDGSLFLAVHAKHGRFDRFRSYLIRSRDHGKTWGELTPMAGKKDDQRTFVEPFVLVRKNGDMIAMYRTSGVLDRYVYQNESTDGGKSWTEPHNTELYGFPSFLMELKDGRILWLRGYRRQPYGLRAVLSRDGGKTWDAKNEIVLRDDGGTSDLGYPSAVEFEDGRVLVVYWFNQEKEGDPESETRYLAGTFFKP